MPIKLNAAPVMVSVISNNVAQTRDFFQNLLGVDFVQDAEALESYHAPISSDGIDLMVGPQRNPNETTTVHFHVDNLDAALQAVSYNGGKVLVGPQSLSMSGPAFARYAESYRTVEPQGPAPSPQLGRMAIVQAPGGSVIGLVQVADHMHKHFQVGQYQRSLQDFQVEHMKAGAENAAALRRQNVIPQETGSPTPNVIP
jgi:predicted enzyme related to lactoylglutathione lyase